MKGAYPEGRSWQGWGRIGLYPERLTGPLHAIVTVIRDRLQQMPCMFSMHYGTYMCGRMAVLMLFNKIGDQWQRMYMG